MVDTAVVLAGGRGTRLHPFTVTFPKPLVPVGNKPILERLLLQLADAEITRVVLSLGYLSTLIRSYLDNNVGLQQRMSIEFVEEPYPLGTAGALGLIENLREPFLVLNGDLLTDIDFQTIARTHEESGAALTIGRVIRTEKIDFGVLDLGPDRSLLRYREKPQHSYSVSMGIYVYSPPVLNQIGRNEQLDFPQLVQRLLDGGEKVSTYLHEGLWLDIGRPDDYARAQELVGNDIETE